LEKLQSESETPCRPELYQLIHVKWIPELCKHHFATPKEIIDLGKDYQLSIKKNVRRMVDEEPSVRIVCQGKTKQITLSSQRVKYKGKAEIPSCHHSNPGLSLCTTNSGTSRYHVSPDVMHYNVPIICSEF
jgi:hypothetical protein